MTKQSSMTKSALISRNTRYNQSVIDLLAELESLSEETLNRKTPTGGWSAIQTMHHLILTEELSLAYVQKKLSFNPKLEPADFAAQWRGFLLWAYLSTPLKFKAPKNVGDENLPDRASFAETCAKWQKIRTDWTDFMEKMPVELSNKAIYRHPRVGRLGWAQMMLFFETHLARHSKQIYRAVQ